MKNKKKGHSGKSGSKGHQVFGSSSHGCERKQRRKMRRLEERTQKKIRQKALRVNKKITEEQLNEIVREKTKPIKQDYESQERIFQRKQFMKLKRLQNRIGSLEDKLRYSIPLDKKEFKPLSGLKGAARPACEVYPEYYPEILERQREEERREDLLEKFEGELSTHEETFEYCFLHIALLVWFIELDNLEEAEKLILKIKGFDDKPNLLEEFYTYRIISLYLNTGDISKACELLKEAKENYFVLWDKVLVEYISWDILQEEENDDKVQKALKEAIDKTGNEIALALIDNEEFQKEIENMDIEFVDYEVEALENFIKNPERILSEDNVEYKITKTQRYFHRSISWFRDVEGIFEYLEGFMSK
eukprot:augustus_masked-scaffold_4-processed-gene-12.43-mRNA-1 protein AED:1.00 eAED:1.00 QI:0/-1/0/0/-1/1/1/0/360